MVVSRPAIQIYTREPDPELLREICAGIEEEGVPCQTTPMEADLDELAYRAAKDSILGVGIGIFGRQAAMQMQRLAKGKNVFWLENPKPWQSRNLGMNSARAVKKMPFRSIEEDVRL